MNWFGEAESLAKAGTPVRRRSWLASSTTATRTVVYVAGAGTTRAVGVVRTGTAEDVATLDTFGAAEFLATDWEAAG